MTSEIDPAALEAATLAAQEEQKRQAASGDGSGVGDIVEGVLDIAATGAVELVGSAVAAAVEGAGSVISVAGEAAGAVIGGLFEGLGS